MKRIFIVFLSVMATTCKPIKDQSTIESIDNFARKDNSIQYNWCGLRAEDQAKPMPWLKNRMIDAVEKVHQGEVIETLHAVPILIQRMFFVGNGRILVTPHARDICRNAPLSDAETQFATETGGVQLKACWMTLDQKAIEGVLKDMPQDLAADLVPRFSRLVKGGGKIALVVDESSKTIRHSLVRLFGYLFSEFYVTAARLLPPNSRFKTRLSDVLKAFAHDQARLKEAFFRDLKERPSVLKFMQDFYRRDRERFHHFLFAEAVDSYYCSRATRSAFAAFKATWTEFVGNNEAQKPGERVPLAQQIGPNLLD